MEAHKMIMKFQLLFSISFIFLPSAWAIDEVEVTDIPVKLNHFQFGESTSYRMNVGRFDPYGYYTPLPAGSSSIAISESFKTSYRFSKEFEAGMTIPIRRTDLTVPTGSIESTTIGSASFETRYHLSVDSTHISIHAGFTTPWSTTSTTTTGNPSASQSDSTGDPSFVTSASARLGIGATHNFSDFRAAIDITGTHLFASDQVPSDAPPGTASLSIQKGNRIQVTEGLAYKLSKQWSVSTGMQQMWSGDTYANGIDEIGTATRTFSTTEGVEFAASEDWHLALTYSNLWPFYDYAANSPYGPSISLSVSFMNLKDDSHSKRPQEIKN